MVIINLLPWRDAKARYEKWLWQSMFGGTTAILISTTLSMYAWLSYQTHDITSRLHQTQQTITRLEKMRQTLPLPTASHESQQPLTIDRETTHHLFTALNQAYSPTVCLTALSRSRNTITLTGHSRSITDLLNQIKQWQTFTVFSDLVIEQLQQQRQHVQFRVRTANTPTMAASP